MTCGGVSSNQSECTKLTLNTTIQVQILRLKSNLNVNVYTLLATFTLGSKIKVPISIFKLRSSFFKDKLVYFVLLRMKCFTTAGHRIFWSMYAVKVTLMLVV